MPAVNIFGREYILRLLRAPRFKKPFTVATPPPWYKNPGALSKGQVAQILRFSQVATATRGMKLKERMEEIRAKASGPTGLKAVKPKVYLPRIGRILTLAQEYGLEIPPELRRAVPVATPVTAPTPPRIRE
ncbi:MAG: hypothetical protein QXM12_02960 [Nitrososphaerota archaeon]